MTTRLIVKNLPSNCTEASLRKFFSKHGTITDASLKYTKEGKFRKFAFVGFLDEESAKKAVNQTNQAFMGTSKLQVEECRPFGDTDKPRAWSLYSKDSSAYKRKHGDKEKDQNIQTPSESEPNVKKKKKDEKYQQFLEAKGVKTEKEQKFVVSKEEKQLLDELLEGVHGDTSLSLTFTGLPSSIKLKNIKEWLNPIRVKALKISRTEETAAAFVTFNRPPDVRKALERDSQFLGGYKVNIRKVDIGNEEEDKRSNNENFSKNPEYSPEKEEEVIREKILDTGRLFLRNLPFATTEDDLHFVFKKYGEVGEVQVITNKTDGRCKGFAIVEFVFPESAVAAYSAMDGRIFKGRMMHILPGEEKREKEEEEEDVKEKGGDLATTSSFKRQKEEKQKANAQKSHSWNALFLGANAVADTLAERLSVSKSDLLTGESGQSAGVRMALAETRLVQETRDFLIENGVRLDAFSKPATKRSSTVILTKNLPANVSEEELQRMFERFGDCKKVLIPPQGGVSALIIMGNAVDAKKAFKALAYSRFRTQPLYLEWAPHDAISGSETSAEKVEGVEENTKTKKSKRELTYEEKVRERKRRQGILEEEEKEEVEEAVEEAENDQKDEEKATETVKNGEEDIFEPESTLFVKNLSFDTNDAALDAFFRRKYNIRSAQVSKKLNPSNPSKNLSMGFGFVQFYTRNEAMKALKEMQGELLEGHSIELKISHRQTLDKDSMKRKTVEKTKQGDCTKILVRNIPFTAKIKEVESLFSTFGDIQNVRIPKKLGSKDQHRGFGFVDFASKEEAKRAFDSLVHSTHLYGRHLVLEWAKEDDSVEELREKTAEKFSGEKGAKKKRKAQLEAIQKQLQVVDDEKQ